MGEFESVVTWHAARPDVRVAHPSGVQFGFRLANLTYLAELEVPSEIADAKLRSCLSEVLDDEPWIGEWVLGEPPTRAPMVKMPWRSIALVQAAEVELADQVNPLVVDLDRALALDRIGATDSAAQLLAGRANTVVEVVELLHDAGIAAAQIGGDLIRLLELAGQTWLISDLRLRGNSTESHRTESAIDDMFRSVLTLPEPAALLDAKEREPAALSEAESVSIWRTQRRIRASRQALVGVDGREDRAHVTSLFEGQRKAAREALGARVLKLSLERATSSESSGDPEPLLAELAFCLFSARNSLEHSLVEAAKSDARPGDAG